MSLEFFIARRYLRSKHRTGFISLITYISIGGVVIGVAALIIILSVMNGYEYEVRSRLIGVDGHVKVGTYHSRGVDNYASLMEQLKTFPHVVAMSPYLTNKGFIISDAASTAIQIKGISPEQVVKVLDVSQIITSGSLDLGRIDEQGKILYGILLGENLARKLALKTGDDVIVASLAGITRMGQMPNKMRFRVNGLFQTGLYEYDSSSAFISVAAAQLLFHMPDLVTGIELKLDNMNNAEAVADHVRDKFGYPYRALTWADLNANLYAWYKIQKWAGFIVLSLIIMVAAFNIVSTLIMVSMEKTKEIGILKSLGATPQTIRRIFTYEGLFVGISGTMIGLISGFLLCWVQKTFRILALPQDVYIIGWLPILMRWFDFLLIALVAIIITLVAAVYPAARAARLDPVAAIRED
jgi:lipoprotein-releasing system permease protein